MVSLYDIKRDSTTLTDGVPTTTWTVVETRNLEVQPIQFSQREGANRAEVVIGGIKYVPTFVGWGSQEVDITATDRITADSGTTDYLVLRTYLFEDHREFDLRQVDDKQ